MKHFLNSLELVYSKLRKEKDYLPMVFAINFAYVCSLERGRAELRAVFKSNDESIIMAKNRLAYDVYIYEQLESV